MDLALPRPVGRLRASVLHSDRTRLKEQLLRGLWLTQAGGRRGTDAGEPAAAEAGVTLLQPEAHCAFSQGSCRWITGPWQWRAAQAPRTGGGDSDLCSHTGFLVAAAAALVSHARLWSSFKRHSESPLLAHQETKRQEKVSCLFGSSRLFPGLPPS